MYILYIYIFGRGVLTPLFYVDPPKLPTPLFQILFNPLPVGPKPHSQCSFCCLLSLTKWVIAILFNDIMDPHM